MKQHPAFDDILYALENYKDRTALVDKDGTAYSYEEFRQYISGAYQELEKRGVKKGSKILVAVPMSLQLYAVLEAIFALGATAIFLDPWMKGKKMGSVINQVNPDLFVVTKKLSRITWLLPATWKLKKWKISEIIPSSDSYPIAEVKDEDNALITFTSGTSGKPKGANRTFAFLHAQAEVLKAHLGESTKSSVDYTNFPIVGLANFALGNTVIIPKINLMKIHQANAEAIVQDLQKYAVRRLVVSPSLLKKILSALPKKNTLKTVMTGGAPISIGLVKSGIEHYQEINFEAIYGSTEAEPICVTPFQTIYDHLNEPLKGVYVGQTVEETDLRILDFKSGPISTNEFNERIMAEGKIGEVVVTGDHVNKNYYENPEAFAKNKIVDSNGTIWHRTGDMGYLENNILRLVGRDHRIMLHKTGTFYPYPIEQFVEMEFGLDDTGYLQKENQFYLYYYSNNVIDENELQKRITENDYPLDHIIQMKKPLPRDARHKSKLQIEQL